MPALFQVAACGKAGRTEGILDRKEKPQPPGKMNALKRPQSKVRDE